MHYHRVQGRIVTTAGIARREGKLFLARRSSGGSEHGKWEFPGGKCDAHETLQGCLAREFVEEFEIDVRVGEEIGRVAFEHEGEPFVLVGIGIELQEDPEVLREHSEWGWYTADEAVTLDLTDSDRALLAMVPRSPP